MYHQNIHLVERQQVVQHVQIVLLVKRQQENVQNVIPDIIFQATNVFPVDQ